MLTIKDIKEGTFDINNSTYDYSQERSIYYQRYSNKKTSYSKFTNDISYNDELMYVDLLSCFNENNDIIFIIVTLPSSTASLIGNSTSSKSYTDVYDFTDLDNVREINLNECNNITAYFPIDESKVNLEKYSHYNKANIDIYKPTEKAFCESCYITNGFNYDLTQKFRRTQIYENKTFISDDCRYDSIDIQMNKIKMLCNYNANLTYSYRIQEKYLDIKNLNKIDNLPFKCASSVEKLKSNIGFWSHFILTIIIIASGTVYSIIHYYQTYYKNNIIIFIKTT